jgi:hypothetical protein
MSELPAASRPHLTLTQFKNLKLASVVVIQNQDRHRQDSCSAWETAATASLNTVCSSWNCQCSAQETATTTSLNVLCSSWNRQCSVRETAATTSLSVICSSWNCQHSAQLRLHSMSRIQVGIASVQRGRPQLRLHSTSHAQVGTASVQPRLLLLLRFEVTLTVQCGHATLIAGPSIIFEFKGFIQQSICSRSATDFPATSESPTCALGS